MSHLKVVGAATLLMLAVGCDSRLMLSHGPAPAARASVAVRGTVMGTAAACRGNVLLGPAPALAVSARRQGKWVARQVVPAPARGHGRGSAPAPRHGRYALRLKPGTYLIGAPASADPPELVAVRAGRTVVVDFPDPCR